MKRPLLEFESVLAILITGVVAMALHWAFISDMATKQIKIEELKAQQELYRLTFTKLSQ